MIFEALSESAGRGELILVNWGMLRYHARRDGTVTIREILVDKDHRRNHVGSQMLHQLRHAVGRRPILARCPADLEANGWYARMGFRRVGETMSRSGRAIVEWRLDPS